MSAPAGLGAEVAAFLHHEAELLDARRLEAWLELFAPDGRLWVPGRAGDADPSRHVSIIYDDVPRLRARVTRLLSGKEYAQEPPSATLRQITNVVAEPPADGLVTARAVVVVHETRGLGAPLLTLPGRASYRLRPSDGHDGSRAGPGGPAASRFRIVEKRFDLLEVGRHFETLAFLL